MDPPRRRLNGEVNRYRTAAEQLEPALLALKEQSAAKERDAQDRLESLKEDSDRMLRAARADWQREVARRLESAGVQILAVFDTEATSQ
jgi:F0F1-type ATP synthase membrane subunit b/b'